MCVCVCVCVHLCVALLIKWLKTNTNSEHGAWQVFIYF